LNEEKSKILKATKKVMFLGAWRRIKKQKEKKMVKKKSGKISRVTARMSITAPIKDKIRKSLVKTKIVKMSVDGKAVATGRNRMVNLDHADIIRYYNAIIRGILNYYSFADNRSSLGKIVWILHRSCAHTLVRKYKRSSVHKCYKKFGKNLACPKTNLQLYKPSSLNRIRLFSVQEPVTLDALEVFWTKKRTATNLGKGCIICGAKPAEIHHLRSIKSLKDKMVSASKKEWFTRQMEAINRKQVPLCPEHHRKVHLNALTPEEKKQFLALQDLMKISQNKLF
jgi:hypothetical protein